MTQRTPSWLRLGHMRMTFAKLRMPRALDKPGKARGGEGRAALGHELRLGVLLPL
jgi:hypothetical protein